MNLFSNIAQITPVPNSYVTTLSSICAAAEVHPFFVFALMRQLIVMSLVAMKVVEHNEEEVVNKVPNMIFFNVLH